MPEREIKMAKKDTENFDFDTEGKAKFNLDLSFLKNLTKQQKGIILIAAVAVVLVIAIVITCVALGTNNGTSNSGSGGNNASSGADANPESITTFSISASPTKSVYYVGEQPDFTGLTVYFKTADNAAFYESYEDNPDDFKITGFDSSAPVEEQKITVEYKWQIATFTIKIIEVPEVAPVLQSIYLASLPKTEYKVGGTFFALGAKIIAVYSDGTTKEISLKKSNLSGFNEAIQTPGEHEIKVGYFDDNGGYAETTFTINVTE